MARALYIAAAAILAAVSLAGSIEIDPDAPLESVAYCLIIIFEKLLSHLRTVPKLRAPRALGGAIRTVLTLFRRQNPYA